MSNDELLTIEELAEILRTTPGSLHQRRYRGDPMPPAIKLGRRLLYRHSDVDKFINSLVEEAPDA